MIACEGNHSILVSLRLNTSDQFVVVAQIGHSSRLRANGGHLLSADHIQTDTHTHIAPEQSWLAAIACQVAATLPELLASQISQLRNNWLASVGAHTNTNTLRLNDNDRSEVEIVPVAAASEPIQCWFVRPFLSAKVRACLWRIRALASSLPI